MVCVFDEPLTDVAVLPGDLEADLRWRGMVGEGIRGGVERGVERKRGGGRGELLGDEVEGTGEVPWLPPLDCTGGDKNLSLSLLSLCTGSIGSSSAVIFWAISIARSFRSSNP